MKKIWIGAVSMLLCLLLTLTGCVGSGIVTVKSGKVQSPDGGETSFSLDEEGTLHLSGSGAVAEVPVEKKEVKKVSIDSGFDAIGANAFSDMPNLKEVEIPDSVKSVEKNAFKNDTSVEVLQLPKSTVAVDASAFEGWVSTQVIVSEWYVGSADGCAEWFDFAEEFGEEVLKEMESGTLSEENQVKISEWWQQWKGSDYWKKAAQNWNDFSEQVEKKMQDVQGDAKSWFFYWNDFGMYLFDDSGKIADFPGAADWWNNVKDFVQYLTDAVRNGARNIPEALREYAEAHRDEIDSYINQFKEALSAGTAFSMEKIKDFIQKNFD